MATFVETDIQSEAEKCSRKKRKRNRFIKQGYHRSERDDTRRVAARTFLSGIPLDSQSLAPYTSFSRSPSDSFQSQQDTANAQTPQGVPQHSLFGEVDTVAKSPLTPNVSLGSPKYVHKKLSPVHFPHSLEFDPVFYEPNESFDRHFSVPNELSGGVCICHNVTKLPPTVLMDKQLMLTCQGNSPLTRGSLFAISSVISYKRSDQPDLPQRTRARANSLSLQIDLDIDLSRDHEVSLDSLLHPLWVSDYATSDLTPPLSRKGYGKRDYLSDPRPIRSFHSKSSVYQMTTSVYPWSHFKENHGSTFVISRYHPHCLDNSEYFLGSQTHFFRLEGKRVSIVHYSRPHDIKKAINEQFANELPHVRISLSKLRSLKRDMHKAAKECDVDLEAVAYSFVYFEKLILMGKVKKANRKIIAGVCLLLAAKFYSDLRQKDLKNLVNQLADQFHVSTKELVLYEFPVLVSLQFSLLVPYHQAFPHYITLRDSELALN